MDPLFEPSRIGNLSLSNRFVRSATWEGLADERGAPTPRLIQLLVELAKGEVGLIISSHAYVSREGQAGPWQLGIYEDGLVPRLEQLTRAVHEEGGGIVAQLAHAGYFANPTLTGEPPLAPSLPEGKSKTPRRAMEPQDIARVVEAFGQAARRAREAGFDGIQIHSAHGYLLSQFLSPAFNRRTDEYGGPIQNRVSIHLETFKAIRRAVGPEYPVLIKINAQDYTEGGLTLQDSLHAVQRLQAEGLDAVELSGGLLTGGKLSPSRMAIKDQAHEAYFREEARAFKKVLDLPLILVGGIRSVEVARALYEEGVADYFSMSRPLIREPHLVRRWKQGDRRRAACISDNQCFGPAMAGEGIRCVHEKTSLGKELP